MHRAALVAFMAALLALSSGCFRHEYVDVGTRSEPHAQVHQWHHHLLWGLVNVAPRVALDRICPGGVARITNWMGPLQALISYVTAGIYTPTTVRVYCAAGGRSAKVGIQLDDEVIATLSSEHPDLEDGARAAARDLEDASDRALRPPPGSE
ncbi:MAG: Bor/Iss family lipoprotein [Myxococcota bacterium]